MPDTERMFVVTLHETHRAGLTTLSGRSVVAVTEAQPGSYVVSLLGLDVDRAAEALAALLEELLTISPEILRRAKEMVESGAMRERVADLRQSPN